MPMADLPRSTAVAAASFSRLQRCAELAVSAVSDQISSSYPSPAVQLRMLRPSTEGPHSILRQTGPADRYISARFAELAEPEAGHLARQCVVVSGLAVAIASISWQVTRLQRFRARPSRTPPHDLLTGAGAKAGPLLSKRPRRRPFPARRGRRRLAPFASARPLRIFVSDTRWLVRLSYHLVVNVTFERHARAGSTSAAPLAASTLSRGAQAVIAAIGRHSRWPRRTVG